MGGKGFCSNETRLVRRLRKPLCTFDFSQYQTSENKRLAIDLSALKQLVWDNRADCDEEVDGSKGDYPRWIDTSAMPSDCLTKTMTSCRLNETLIFGIFDLAIKAKNRKWKASKEEQERVQDPDN